MSGANTTAKGVLFVPHRLLDELMAQPSKASAEHDGTVGKKEEEETRTGTRLSALLACVLLLKSASFSDEKAPQQDRGERKERCRGKSERVAHQDRVRERGGFTTNTGGGVHQAHTHKKGECDALIHLQSAVHSCIGKRLREPNKQKRVEYCSSTQHCIA